MTDHVNAFIENIYKKDDKAAFKLVSIEENQQEFNAILNQVRSGLEEGYIDTRIVSFKVTEGGYFVTGGVYTENETLDLFVMQLKDTGETLKIIAFSF